MGRELKSRQEYLSKLIKHIDTDAVKVVTGVRGCGKSALMRLFSKFLIWREVEEECILLLNLDLPRYRNLVDYQKFYVYVSERIKKGKKNYLLLDELHVVEGFEKAIEAIKKYYNVDIYIVTSNVSVLSSNFLSLFQDRYVEVKVLPLSFLEFITFHDFNEEESTLDKFEKYLRFGGMPGINGVTFDEKECFDIIESSYATSLLQDVLRINKTVNYPVFEQVVKYLCVDIGKARSPNSISEVLSKMKALEKDAERKGKSNGDANKVKLEELEKATEQSIVGRTVGNHINMLEKAFIFYTVNRYDIKDKKVLKTLNKRYITDLGLCNMLVDYGKIEYVYVLENIVFLELLRRDYDIYVGKFRDMEIDFVAKKQGERIYIQVVESIACEENRENALNPLKAINDNYEKIVLSMDKDLPSSYDGIKSINVIDWLVEKQQRI